MGMGAKEPTTFWFQSPSNWGSNMYNKEYYEANKEKHSGWMRTYYQTHKAERRAYNDAYDQAHKEEREAYHKQWRQELKLAVLTYYSIQDYPICARCGEKDTDVLCIDHINGGGGKHVREINKAGNTFYGWLRKNNYPEGFQVLCANCNLKKRIQEKEN